MFSLLEWKKKAFLTELFMMLIRGLAILSAVILTSFARKKSGPVDESTSLLKSVDSNRE